MAGSWRNILILWFTGILAATALGKFAALAPLIRTDLSLSLAEAGWLISLVEIGGATLGLVAGVFLARRNLRSTLAAGLALLSVASLGQFVASDATILFASRIVESLGYLLIVIAAPSLIAITTPPAIRGKALALWSTFVPAGMALGSALTAIGTLAFSWQVLCLIWGALAVLCLLPLWSVPDAHVDAKPARIVLPGVTAWLLAIGWGCFTLLEVGALALLPAYLAEEIGLSPSLAGTVVGVASAATLIGGAAAPWILRHARSGPDSPTVALAAALGLLVPALLLFVVFTPRLAENSLPWLVVATAILLNAVMGIVPALLFALLPAFMGDRGADQAGMASANGLLAQLGAGGSLAGPPLLAIVATRAGWSSVPAVILALSIAALVLFALARRRRRIIGH